MQGVTTLVTVNDLPEDSCQTVVYIGLLFRTLSVQLGVDSQNAETRTGSAWQNGRGWEMRTGCN